MGLTGSYICADVNAVGLFPGIDSGCISGRGLFYEYHHPTDALFSFSCGILSEVCEENRNWNLGLCYDSLFDSFYRSLDNIPHPVLGIGHSIRTTGRLQLSGIIVTISILTFNQGTSFQVMLCLKFGNADFAFLGYC